MYSSIDCINGVHMKKDVALTFTARGINRILAEGGSGDWTVNPSRASADVAYVVCCQNTRDKRKGNDWGEATHKHGQGFLVGKVSEIVLVTTDPSKKPRYRFEFSEYAEIKVDHLWTGNHFPVGYMSKDELPFNIDALEFKSIEKVKAIDRIFSLDQAKEALAKLHQMKKTNVKIML